MKRLVPLVAKARQTLNKDFATVSLKKIQWGSPDLSELLKKINSLEGRITQINPAKGVM